MEGKEWGERLKKQSRVQRELPQDTTADLICVCVCASAKTKPCRDEE